MPGMEQREGFGSRPHVPMNRRGFLWTAGVGLGALALGGGGLVSGCTQGRGNVASDKLARVSLSLPFDELDPITASGEATIAVNDLVFENLYRADRFPPYKISPEIAAELPRQVTPTTYRIKLREGVSFHDGGSMAAEDAVFSLGRMKDKEVASWLGPYFDLIVDMRVIGSHEIEVELAEPTSILAQRLKLLPILSRAAVEASADTLTTAPVGTGPFQVTSVVPQEHVLLKRFAEYSGGRKLQFKELKVGVVADPNARVAGLRTAETDVALAIPASAYGGLKTANGLKVEAVPGPWSTHIFFNNAKSPFDDVRVRQAVLYAIDRDSITESTFFGLAEPAWAGMVRTDNPDYAEPDTVYKHDPDLARKLIADSNHGSSPIPIDLPLASDVDFIWSQGPIIEQNLKDVGFAPNIIPGSFSAVGDKMLSGDYHVTLGYGSMVLDPTVEFDLQALYSGTFPETFLHWTGQELDSIRQHLATAESAPEPATSRQHLAEAQNILQEMVPNARLHWLDAITGWSAVLEGFRALPINGFLLDDVHAKVGSD